MTIKMSAAEMWARWVAAALTNLSSLIWPPVGLIYCNGCGGARRIGEPRTCGCWFGPR